MCHEVSRELLEGSGHLRRLRRAVPEVGVGSQPMHRAVPPRANNTTGALPGAQHSVGLPRREQGAHAVVSSPLFGLTFCHAVTCVRDVGGEGSNRGCSPPANPDKKLRHVFHDTMPHKTLPKVCSLSSSLTTKNTTPPPSNSRRSLFKLPGWVLALFL